MKRDRLSISRYPVYKDSEIEWLGNVPDHWKIQRIKDLSVLQSGNNVTSDQIEEVGEYPVYGGNGLRGYFSKYTNDGDYILIGRQGALCGNVNYASGKFWATEHAVVVYLKRCFCMKWYGEIIRVMNLNQYSLSAAQPGLSVDRIKRLLFPVPPLPEQKEIADYLDTKTAQIDRKIDLLTQKAERYGNLKQSLINETVTRGFDRSLPMKDSGIEWIGDVPKHWAIKRVKEIFDISRGRVIAQTELIEDGCYPVYSSQTKDNGCLGYINTFDYEGEYITWTTDGANAGTVFLRTGQFNCTNICGTLKLKSRNQSINYVFYSLQVSTKHNKRIDTNGAKIMSNEMAFIKIATPPLSEQIAIADYLDTKTAQIDRVIQTINTQIGKLKELRKTLINDVVTGKIKVV